MTAANANEATESSFPDTNTGSRDAAAKDPVSALARFVVQHARRLPAEETAMTVVQDIFLPRLHLVFLGGKQSAVKNHQTMSMVMQHGHTGVIAANNNDDQDDGSLVLQAVHALLLIETHASAILASLTEIVDDETGTEHVVANPVRSQLFRVLQNALPRSASCLTTAIRAARKIDGALKLTTHGTADSDLSKTEELNLQILVPFLKIAVLRENKKQQHAALDLQLALLQSRPAYAQSLVAWLLWREPTKSMGTSNPYSSHSCSTCGFRCRKNESCSSNVSDDAPAFLNILHGAIEVDTARVAMECAAQILLAIPFRLWLKSDKTDPSSMPKKGYGSMRSPSAFQRCVAAAIKDLVCIAHCRLAHLVNDATLSFARAILRDVPYFGSNDSNQNRYKYEECAVPLVEILAANVSMKRVRELLVECLGGQATPSGRLTERCAPVASWLRSERGRAFVDKRLLAPEPQHELFSTQKLTLSVLRGCPDLILCNAEAWALFQRSILTHCQSNPLTSAQRMEALLRGRCQLADESYFALEASRDAGFLSFVMPVLETFASIDQTEQTQCLGLNCFSLLLHSDWWVLGPKAVSYVTRIVTFCVDTNHGSVQAASCKAIGDICQNLVQENLSDDSIVTAKLVDVIFQALLDAMVSEEPSVQCMSLFAVGNLAQSLDSLPKHIDGLNAKLIRSTSELSLNHMSSSNEKVAANSVRTTGWLACLVLNYREQMKTTCSDFDVVSFVCRVVQFLAQRVQIVVETSRVGGSAGLSWKQRSGIKKNGWGACNTLAILFEHQQYSPSEGCHEEWTSVYQMALECLMGCVASLTVVNEKVVVAAISAIRAFYRSTLSGMISGVANLGATLVACCVFVFDDSVVSTSRSPHVDREVRLLLPVLFSYFTTYDVLQSLGSVQFVSTLPELYRWMDKENCSPQCFQNFVKALKISDVAIDLDLEQHFTSHYSAGTFCHDQSCQFDEL